MITHETCREEMSAWLDGELSRGRAAEIRAHLDGCAACSEHLAQLRRVSQEVRGLPRETMPADLRADILRAARRVPAAPRRALWTFAASSLSVTAGVAALVLIVVVLRQNEPGLSEPARSLEQERAASAADIDDGKLAFRQAAVSPEKKAGESSLPVEGLSRNEGPGAGAGKTAGDTKQLAKAAPAAPPAAVTGGLDKDETFGAPTDRRSAFDAAAPVAGALGDAPAEPSEEPESHFAPDPPRRYVAQMVESTDDIVMLRALTPLDSEAPPQSRDNVAGKESGNKSKLQSQSGSREPSAQAQSAAPSATREAVALRPDPQQILRSRHFVELTARVDEHGNIVEIAPVIESALTPARMEQVRTLLVGQQLPGLPPGARTAVIELTISPQE